MSSINNNIPEVSVLMSCYNGSRWLEGAINSILSQSFTSFELILINDGSKDETWNIIQKYSEIDNRIVAINKINSGLADSLNIGISIAKGKWIARLDQDDLCESTRLEEQLDFMKNHPQVVLLGSGFTELDEHNNVIKKHYYPSKHKQLLRNLEKSKRFFPHSSAFYNVDIVRGIGGYNERIHRAEDLCLWLKLVTIGEIACLSRTFVKIRKHNEQMSLDENGQIQYIDATAVRVCYFLRKLGYEDPSNKLDITEWILFRDWIEKRLGTLGIFKRQNSWVLAREIFFNSENKIIGSYNFIISLIHSGNFFDLFIEKIAGSSLSIRLAKEWGLKTTSK